MSGVPSIPSAIPAATLVLFREGGAVPELLFVERSRTMAFAGGALVFPGGRIDPGDYALAADYAGDRDDAAARIAAIRETLEEVGVPIGLSPLDPGALSAIRHGLHSGRDFAATLADHGATLAIDMLVPFARWLPTHAPVRIFDTRFYLGRMPEDAPDPVVDDTENVRVFWATARSVLDAADAGSAKIIFPTRRNLERLALFDSFDAAVADAAIRPVRTVSPWIEDRGGVAHLCIPNDLGYPVVAEPMSAIVRG